MIFFAFFFFNDTATTEIYTLSLHDALPISLVAPNTWPLAASMATGWRRPSGVDRKSTRLNSSHGYISYAVFCLKKKITSGHLALLLTVLPNGRYVCCVLRSSNALSLAYIVC